MGKCYSPIGDHYIIDQLWYHRIDRIGSESPADEITVDSTHTHCDPVHTDQRSNNLLHSRKWQHHWSPRHLYRFYHHFKNRIVSQSKQDLDNSRKSITHYGTFPMWLSCGWKRQKNHHNHLVYRITRQKKYRRILLDQYTCQNWPLIYHSFRNRSSMPHGQHYHLSRKHQHIRHYTRVTQCQWYNPLSHPWCKLEHLSHQ